MPLCRSTSSPRVSAAGLLDEAATAASRVIAGDGVGAEDGGEGGAEGGGSPGGSSSVRFARGVRFGARSSSICSGVQHRRYGCRGIQRRRALPPIAQATNSEATFSMRELSKQEATAARSTRGRGAGLSRSARRDVRQAVALAAELNLYSVALHGTVWTLRHDKMQPKPEMQ